MPTSKPSTVAEYIAALPEPRRSEIKTLHAMITKALPKLEPSIQYAMIGYGTYHYKYDSGREGDAPIIALASRAAYISVYVYGEEIRDDVKRVLPKADFGKGCIRFKKLADIDIKALEKLVKASAQARQMSHASAGS